MDDELEAAEDAKFAQIPPDFPKPALLAAVPGFQRKLLLTKFRGRYFSPGCTPPEIWERWNACEDLAQQLREKSLESKAGKRSHMTEAAILDQYLQRLLKTGWRSDAEMRWVIRRTAGLLQWSLPESAREPSEVQE
jgi:hypothetical protein